MTTQDYRLRRRRLIASVRSADQVRRTLFRAILCCVMSGCIHVHAQAQYRFDLPLRTLVWNEVFDSFDTARYHLGTNSNFDAAARNVTLTPPAASVMGRLFLKRLHDDSYYDISFDAYFGYRGTANGTGADGIAFATAPIYDYPASGGGSLNFDGCGGSGVEFDTYFNPERNDPDEEHIAGIVKRTDDHRAPVTLPLQTLKDGRWHRVAIRERLGSFEVTLDGARRAAIVLNDYVPGDAYFGFTSSTGASFNEHRIDNVSLSVPSRLSERLDDFSACDTVTRTVRVVVANNHPDQIALGLWSATLRELDASGEFALTGNPVPTTQSPGDQTSFSVQFTGTGSGTRRAVLRVNVSNDEHVEDTLSVSGVMPAARWSTLPLQFPPVHVGNTADRTVMLRNTGTVPITIRQLTGQPPMFRVVSPSSFPFVIAAGDSMPVVVRFAPTQAGVIRGFVDMGSTCGDVVVLPLAGEAFVKTLRLSIPGSPIMLLPGRDATIPVVLTDDPTGTTAIGFTAEFHFDPSIMRLTGFEVSTGVFPGGSAMDLQTPGAGTIVVRRRATFPLTTTGTVFAFRFQPSRTDSGCGAVRIDNVVWNADEVYPGIPYGAGDEARCCINPSCRTPEGLRRLPMFKITNDPNPFTASTRVRLDVPEESDAELAIVNSFGERLRSLGRRVFPAGAHVLDVSGEGLPDGLIYLAVIRAAGVEYHPLVHIR
jgi:hypothetical protein